MAREFQRGHKARVSDLTAGTDLYVGVRIDAPGLTFDISCFGLDEAEQLSDDRYFIFFNQPASPEESLQLLGAQAGDTESFRVTLDRVPAAIHKLSFTATIDGAGQMSDIGPGYIRIVAGGEEVVRYAFTGTEFTTERAVMLGDFYRKDVWRFAAVGQGFDGGLDALLKNFGGEIAEEETPDAPPEPPSAGPVPGFAVPTGSAAPAPAPVATPPPAPAFVPAPAPAFPSVHTAQTIVAPLSPPPVGAVPPPPVPPPAPAPYGQPVPAPYGGPPPGASYGGAPHGVPQGPPPGGAGLAAALQPYRELPTGQRWTVQNSQLVRVDLGTGGTPVLARQGSMVMYQGKVDFGYKGAGFTGRIVGNATGQEMQLMRCTGKGQVFLAEEGAHLHPVELQGDGICVSAENVLAFDEGLHYEVRRIEGHGIPGGALFTMVFQGTGTVVVKTHGTPVVLPVTPTTFADANAVVAWSAASQVIVSSQVRLRRNAYPGHSGETVNLQFRGAPGNFIVVQPYEV
ncbi:TerD family protein [Streptomyces paludis]|uniref:Stress protein n=1 Tax=Streptomyces paludis TaxID=2282738 RepID=A0A345HTX1_9ACTN|nr:TerD family protein [Streptomyces paludis]AXG80145.1 stress protein [Streptomyces paludis]